MNIIQNRYKYLLLSVVVNFTAILSITRAADNAISDIKTDGTPQRGVAIITVTGLAPTPGQRTAHLQNDMFSEERFVKVFGEEVFTSLLGTLASDSVNARKSFNTLSNTSIAYDDPRKRTLMRKVKQWFAAYQGIRSNEYLLLSDDLMRLDTIIATVPYNRINESSTQYFQDRYPSSTITCSSKMGGDQLGTVVKIQNTNDRTLKYYVKTHSKGLKSGHSSAAQLLIPQELMVYKVLEGLGIGCESHFFGRDGKHFYIATLDANTDGEFKEYSKFDRDKADEVVPIWGSLINLSDDARKNEAAHDVIEASISSDQAAKEFIHQMSILDILARLMLLTDLQTNGDNFGFVNVRHSLSSLRVIDFRLHETDNFKLTERDFGGFLVGNGFFNYYAADKAVCYALRNRPVQYRVAEVKSIFERDLAQWETVVEAAKNETIHALSENGLDTGQKFISDLEHHAEILKANFQLFKTMLDEWSPDERQ
jgi:hypothetical protein